LNWLVPPPRLIIDCINKLYEEKVDGVLVIPYWVTSNFWPNFIKAKKELSLQEICILSAECAIIRGRGNNKILENGTSFIFCLL